jgi:hypothetical protein
MTSRHTIWPTRPLSTPTPNQATHAAIIDLNRERMPVPLGNLRISA